MVNPWMFKENRKKLFPEYAFFMDVGQVSMAGSFVKNVAWISKNYCNFRSANIKTTLHTSTILPGLPASEARRNDNS